MEVFQWNLKSIDWNQTVFGVDSNLLNSVTANLEVILHLCHNKNTQQSKLHHLVQCLTFDMYSKKMLGSKRTLSSLNQMNIKCDITFHIILMLGSKRTLTSLNQMSIAKCDITFHTLLFGVWTPAILVIVHELPRLVCWNSQILECSFAA